MHAVVARRTFPSSKCKKKSRSRTTFGSSDVEKVHAVVGVKHISKSKCGKRTNIGPLLEVEMSKMCTLLWREAHFQVESVKKLTGMEYSRTFRCRFSRGRRRDCPPSRKEAKREGFVAVSTTATTTTTTVR